MWTLCNKVVDCGVRGLCNKVVDQVLGADHVTRSLSAQGGIDIFPLQGIWNRLRMWVGVSLICRLDLYFKRTKEV